MPEQKRERGEWRLDSFDVGKHTEQHYIVEKADPSPKKDGWYHVAQVKHADDARLLLAAPDLLLACELVKGWIEHDKIACGPVVWAELCRALAKAKPLDPTE